MELLYLYMQDQAALDLGWTFWVPLAITILLLILTVPVWVSVGLGVVALLALTEVLPLTLFGEALFEGVDAFALIAIPLFILTGDVLVRTGLSNKLLDIAEETVGGFKSGLGSATLLGCGFFSCISGSDAAGAAAVGRLTLDRLVDRGYPREYAGALVASGACTGILIPPSIAYIIIGLVLGISASTLFVAAAIPGILILLGFLATHILINRKHQYETAGNGFSFSRWSRAVWEGRFALLVPFVILGGIYSGIFTPTEAAAVAVVTTILIGVIQKTIRLSDFPKMLESSAKVNGVIVPIIAISLPLAQALGALKIPEGFVGMVMGLTQEPTLIILLMITILVLAGCIMEATPNIVILAPILLPLAREIGMHDIQFCVLMITALGVGFITPPLGLNLFVISGLSRVPILSLSRRAVPYMASMLFVVLLLAFVPELSLWAVKG